MLIARPERPLVTLREAADLVMVAPETVRTWVKAGRIPAVRIGPTQKIYVRRRDLDLMERPV